MKAFVDQEGCIACTLCVSICPEVFGMSPEGKSQVIADPIPPDSIEQAREAAGSCPVSVINITD